jgi:excisionase family DNA binding protein
MQTETAPARKLHRVQWAAEQLGISRARVYEYIRQGKLPAVHLGSLVFIDEDAFDEWRRAGGCK